MPIQIQHDDDHTVETLDEVSMTFMALMTHRLNAALRENGIASSEQRQEICAQFMFSQAYELDAGWFQEENVRYFPKLCFLERAKPTEDENLGAVNVVHIPSEASSWHEYAHGVVSDYFESGESLDPPVRTGSYDRENG
ncbi:hypothetical protein CLU86_2701 [Acidovorax sp. 62]|uniref:hypothetical protein n=1 Tax=Acidovorax sp. 62 TaxID=2035203 RepID=UPI000C186FE2|nr:hypothetical protein [Acidovorax sp. 62]PIF91766.1 hypothetical protein CLU86_2701 [Acidovorax sp. 62]